MLSPRVTDALRFAGAVLVTGVAASLFAIVMRLGAHAVLTHGLHAADILVAFEHLSTPARLALPALGGLLAGLVGLAAAHKAGGHGVAEILEAVALGRGRISLSTALWKALGSFVAIVTGGSIGREGPILQFGAAAADAVARWSRLSEPRVRVLVAAGTAAGFTAAYNTPLAAILFVLEIVTGALTLDIVLPIVVATTLSTVLTRLAVGGGPLYGLRTFAVRADAELLAFTALGALAGLLGPAFLALLDAGSALVRRLSLPRPVAGALGGLGVGLIAVWRPEVAGNGYEAIQRLFDMRFAPSMLAVLLVAKAVATVSSVASGSPGGVFTPSLFLGATLGGLLGAALDHLAPALPHGPPGGYALVGMAAMIAATTHAPLMASVLVFELSGDYAVVLPLLLATTGATFVARRLRMDSVYTSELRRRGIIWEGSLAERRARAVHARDILAPDAPWLPPATPLADALALLENSRMRAVYVGTDPVRVLDLHTAKSLWLARLHDPTAPLAATVGEVAAEVPVAHPDDSLLELRARFHEVDWGELPVVDPGPPSRLVGIVRRQSLLDALERVLSR